MNNYKDKAKKTAELLLQIKAVKLDKKNPFTWASGWKSPIYCDNRVILSFPAIRNFVKDELAKICEQLEKTSHSKSSPSIAPLIIQRVFRLKTFFKNKRVSCVKNDKPD